MVLGVDTQFYWNITRHIFRYAHSSDENRYNGIHTVNEGKQQILTCGSAHFLWITPSYACKRIRGDHSVLQEPHSCGG